MNYLLSQNRIYLLRPSEGKSYNMEAICTESEKDESSSKIAYISACQVLKTNPARSILNGLSTKTLLLKHRSLGPTGVKALAAALRHNKTVETLDLEDNGLEGEGAIYICDMLAENTSLREINLARNSFGSVGAKALADVIRSNSKIVRLDLSDNKLHDRDAECLAEAIEKNETITHLNLSHNNFSNNGATSFCYAFGANNSIEHLDLSWNQFSKKAAALLCTGFKRNYCLTSINLSWNGINLEGCTAVCDMLRGNKYLRELDLTHNSINWDGALQISKGLKENDTLESLSVGGNPLSMTGVLDLLDAIDSPQSSVVHISFKGVPVNRKIMYIVESLQKNRKLVVECGNVIEGDDIVGKRALLRSDPLKLLTQFLADKSIKPYEIFRMHDPDKQYKVPREHFVRGLKSVKAPLDEYDYEKLLQRFDPSGKEMKINYQRLIRGVKDQIKQNKAEEKQRKEIERVGQQRDIQSSLSRKTNSSLGKKPKSSRDGFLSPRSTPSPTGDDISIFSPPDETLEKVKNLKSNLSKSSVTSSKSSLSSLDTEKYM